VLVYLLELVTTPSSLIIFLLRPATEDTYEPEPIIIQIEGRCESEKSFLVMNLVIFREYSRFVNDYCQDTSRRNAGNSSFIID